MNSTDCMDLADALEKPSDETRMVASALRRAGLSIAHWRSLADQRLIQIEALVQENDRLRDQLHGRTS